MWTLNQGGPKPSIVACASLLLIGNWIRFAGAKAQGGIFGVVMFGQILIGFSQPFVLTAPTRYSDLWFTDRGRTSATAIATLANPFGGALGQLIGPEMATETGKVADMVLYVAIIVRTRCPFAFSNIHSWRRGPSANTITSTVKRREHPIVFHSCPPTNPSKPRLIR